MSTAPPHAPPPPPSTTVWWTPEPTSATASAVALKATNSVSPLYIMVPPLPSCENVTILLGGSSPPYTLYPVHSQYDWNVTSLEPGIPPVDKAGTFDWKVDFSPGTSLTWVVRDSTNATAYATPVTVHAGKETSCPKNVYTDKPESEHSSSSHTGVIVGLVFGAFAALAIAGALFYFRKSWMPESWTSGSQSGTFQKLPGDGEAEMGLVGNAAPSGSYGEAAAYSDYVPRPGVPTAGTFNMQGIPLNQPLPPAPVGSYDYPRADILGR